MDDNEYDDCDECKKYLRCHLFERSTPVSDGFENERRAMLCLPCARKDGVLKKHLMGTKE